ncbi:peptide-methionine (S)-S-oxide reductase MsrA [Candidatus Omnitrophota bacterium]
MVLKRVFYIGFLLAIGSIVSFVTFAQGAGPSGSGMQKGEGKMTQKATFAAGCFWGIEAAFGKIKGVASTRVGYAGGSLANPTYKDVCYGNTGHAEAVEVEYDSSQVSFEELLEVFWDIHDPTALNRQGPDVGSQYRSAIFFHSSEQEAAAKASKKELQNSKQFKGSIVTQIVPASQFYEAEDYHQKYLEKKGLPGCRL